MKFDPRVCSYSGLLNRHMYAWRKKTGMTDEEAWKVLVEKLDDKYHGFKEKLMSYTERSTNLDLYIVHTLASYPDFEDKFNALIESITKERMNES